MRTDKPGSASQSGWSRLPSQGSLGRGQGSLREEVVDEGAEVGAHSTLHTVSSRGKQRVLPGSVSVWEGSQDLLSLY